MNIKLPEEVVCIISSLEENGYEAYAVGGCVRDSILGNEPKDWDICTSALPEQTKECFKNFRIIETGIRHGTVTLMFEHNQPYEVTTYRVDGKYTDNRRPDSVEFVNNLHADLSRRDFTMNAIAYNPEEGIIDFFDGIKDLENKIIRCVGNPDTRFQEDALRVMRALRFASVLEFTIEEKTMAAIRNNKKLLKNIAVERVTAEFKKLISGRNVSRVMLNYRSVIEEIIPAIKRMDDLEYEYNCDKTDLWYYVLLRLNETPADVISRLAALMHGILTPKYCTDENNTIYFNMYNNTAVDMAKEILSDLRYDKKTIKSVSELILYFDYDIQSCGKHIKRWLNKIGEAMFRRLIGIKKADIKSRNIKYEYEKEKLDEMENILRILDKIIQERQCFLLKDLAVSGSDLIDFGIPKKEIGNILNSLLDMVIDEKIENDREILLDAVRNLNP